MGDPGVDQARCLGFVPAEISQVRDGRTQNRQCVWCPGHGFLVAGQTLVELTGLNQAAGQARQQGRRGTGQGGDGAQHADGLDHIAHLDLDLSIGVQRLDVIGQQGQVLLTANRA